MKVPLKWLKEYVDINVTPQEYADALTLSGSKVEGIEKQGEEILNVVVGKIISQQKHPDADKLQVTGVNVGTGIIQIVTGAQNISVGNYVPVALDGSLLPGGKKIKKGKLRGIESEGMMCAIDELGYTRYDFPDADENGIYVLSPDMLAGKYCEDGASGGELDSKVLGMDIRDVLGINDSVVEFEITPNRPDCLSMLGIARETSATLGTKFTKPEIRVLETDEEASACAGVEIKDAGMCPRYCARIIKNVRIAPSPSWMKERLRAAGIRPINNIVDITNYVMLEMGQPMHAFDLDKLAGSKIIVRGAEPGEVIETLDGSERKLEPGMLVIADEQRPVAVAGVMGGSNSEISCDTTSILFESASFNGTCVRIGSKKLGMRTEASSRFEKGLDVNNVVDALDRAAQLITMLGAGQVAKGRIDCYPGEVPPRIIDLDCAAINKLLGTDIPREEMIAILKRLDIHVDESAGKITVPSFRMDIEETADIAEEVARFYGYNNIVPTLLEGKKPTRGVKTFKQRVEDKIRCIMTGEGLSEAYTYSFASPGVFDRINLPADSELRRAAVISNPLGADYSIMRTTTIPSMLEVLSTNYNRRIEEAWLFELSYTYHTNRSRISQVEGINEKGLPYENETLTVGMYGGADFFRLKGILEQLFGELKISNYEFVRESGNPIFHPGRTAAVVINGEAAGTIGEVHPDVLENYGIDTKAYIAVIEVEKLVSAAGEKIQYRPLPKFPAVSRDLSMLVADDVTVKQIEEIIRQRAGKILESVTLFDVYKGKQVPEGMKSVAYAITFRADDRTLTDEEVGKAMKKVLDGLKNNLEAELRQ
ncbi:phenylalanyl-tRNA synthetase beta subunit [Anaerobacterium chartisolvens]|uniref:Phenylalanine--tRNA ligase beta subunit n=1 Tax=Anaerobacterium chartisolvens TaxID=1297424 RepID=A0A369BAP6_9FIRM|nr:phenylalanine--tRNA ligase subunit beta [Anaerobacterium chartisolvens]RCX17587.1 phenylalanyl-tRNA synthetase beta subunit [Anaerobacterium chartisolvens]